MSSEKIAKRIHEVSIKSKEIITITAVNKVEFLSPETVLIDSDIGKIGIKGTNLFVENLHSESGVAIIKGTIISINYFDKDNKSSWFKRLLK